MISVIIPTHNRPIDVKRAIESVFNQTLPPKELIVIDDGSNPALDNTIFEKSPKSICCKLLKNERPKGACYSRNLGIESATAQYIAFLDDDDYFTKNKLETVTRCIESFPRIDLFYHQAVVEMPNESVTYTTNPIPFDQSNSPANSLLIKNCIGGTSMVIVKRSTLMSVHGFNESMQSLQDYELWLRLSGAKARFKLIPEALTIYTAVTSDNSISKSLQKNQDSIQKIENAFATNFERLSSKEMLEHQRWKDSMLVHKSMMTYRKFDALKYQLRVLKRGFKPQQFFLLLTILISIKFTFKLKGMFKRI